MTAAENLPSASEMGTLQVMHLKRYWAKSIAKKDRKLGHESMLEEWATDVMLLSALGIGIEQTIMYLFQVAPSFPEFEQWVLDVNNGMVSAEKISYFNAQLCGEALPESERITPVLSAADMAFWNENGYIILRNVVPKEDCDKTVELICTHLGIQRDDPASWYDMHPSRQGIMVQLFQHEQLQKNRENIAIRQAFEQLWGRKDIIVNADRVGFNPPETDNYKFPGPRLHWDVSLQLPIPFGLQGILYLADTLPHQGAFTLVPGFHNRVEAWLHSLPPGANPRTQNIYDLGPEPVAANAGDFIIWHQALPHGSSPNTAALPRYVQYFTYQPIDPEIKQNWI